MTKAELGTGQQSIKRLSGPFMIDVEVFRPIPLQYLIGKEMEVVVNAEGKLATFG